MTDFPERFQAESEVFVLHDGSRERLLIESVWFHKGLVNLKFRGFDTISAAETLAGGEIQIPLADRKPLPFGEYYLSDLVGCAVLEDGRTLGTVASVEQTGAAPLLQVLTAEGEILIPFAEEICRMVDLGSKQIHVRLPEGLIELNRPEPRPKRK